MSDTGRQARWRLVMGAGSEQLCGGLGGEAAEVERLVDALSALGAGHSLDPREEVDNISRVADPSAPIIRVVDDARRGIRPDLIAVDYPLDRRAGTQHVAVGVSGNTA